jgi:hypothetical protein
MSTIKYEVQHYTLCDGWINVWRICHDDGSDELEYFDSIEDANLCLDQFLADEQEAFEEGNIESPYDRDEFRIVEVTE